MKDRPKFFIRLAHADQAFQEADAAAEHILTTHVQAGSLLYHALVAGLAVSYMRPFTSATGLGPLASGFTDFADTDAPDHFTAFHADIALCRHKLAAHFDLNYGEQEYREKRYELRPGEVELELRARDFGVSTNHTTLPLERIGQARQLIALQRSRVLRALSDFAVSVAKENSGRLGSYVFTPSE